MAHATTRNITLYSSNACKACFCTAPAGSSRPPSVPSPASAVASQNQPAKDLPQHVKIALEDATSLASSNPRGEGHQQRLSRRGKRRDSKRSVHITRFRSIETQLCSYPTVVAGCSEAQTPASKLDLCSIFANWFSLTLAEETRAAWYGTI